MASKTTFYLTKAPDSSLLLKGAWQGTTSISVDSNRVTGAVKAVIDKLTARDDARNGSKYLDLKNSSSFYVTFNDKNDLKIETDQTHFNLQEKTATVFLKFISEQSSFEWLIEAAVSLISKLVDTLTYLFTPMRHFTKWMKYRIHLEKYEEYARTNDLQKLEGNCEITTAWNSLVETLREPSHFETPDDQYKKTVELLRITEVLIKASDRKGHFEAQLKHVEELDYIRFAGIELFSYCKELVENAGEEQLPSELTFGNFLDEFLRWATKLKNPSKSTAMNPFACEKNRAKGHLNVAFDPLLNASNIPYRDGVISVNGQSTLLLWHGTPVTQNDMHVTLYDLGVGLLRKIPIVGGWISQDNTIESTAEVTDDYHGFIKAADAKKRDDGKGQQILHVILEDGTKRSFGDESGRVKARIRLANTYENFIPIALRLDGEFFERHEKEFKDKSESIENLKDRLKKQLLMPFVGNTKDEQMNEQLKANGFYIPQVLRDGCKLDANIDRLLKEVQEIYFPGVENIENQADHQAFIILSYVHIILFACKEMKIDILEALCKDDKDRGNVIKTILKLHFLYITDQATSENLNNVLTHTLARPFILQKAPIIKSRLVLLKRVIPVISTAYANNKHPVTAVFGERIESPSYTVDRPAGQTLYPNNKTSKTITEYQTFLQHHQPTLIPPQRFHLFGRRQADILADAKQRLLTHLQGTFDNQDLKISVQFESNSGTVTKEGVKYHARFIITDGNVNYGTINASMTIKNDRKPRQAHFEYSLDT